MFLKADRDVHLSGTGGGFSGTWRGRQQGGVQCWELNPASWQRNRMDLANVIWSRRASKSLDQPQLPAPPLPLSPQVPN